MTAERVGILHPGEMGSAVAATVRNSGREVCWGSDGGGHRCGGGAERGGFRDGGSVGHLCKICPIILSVCPPEFAADLANQVLAHGFRGTYLDANALAPPHKQEIAARMQSYGVR